MENFDVFISYHGGAGDESRSSYDKASELYDYLDEKGLHCFLYKKRNDDDFYDAINRGLLTSKHFILVACDKDMLSEWVKDEVKQFDGLRKNGKKPNCLISAYIFGSITVDDLYRFNTMFTTKDIISGENGFEKLYQMIKQKNSLFSGSENQVQELDFYPTQPVHEEISLRFLDSELIDYADFDDQTFQMHCQKISDRLSCMQDSAITSISDGIIDRLVEGFLHTNESNLLKISGQPGTQKSYVLQMLYVSLKRRESEHNYFPIYIHYDIIKEEIKRGEFVPEVYVRELLQESLGRLGKRRLLLIIDGVQNIIVDNYKLDYLFKRIIDQYKATTVLGINLVFEDNAIRLNRSPLCRQRYKTQLKFTPINIYDKEKCIKYISTIIDDINVEEFYLTLKKLGLSTIDAQIVHSVYDCCEYNPSCNIMDIYETELTDFLNGDTNMLSRCAELVFNYAYNNNEMDYDDPLTLNTLALICRGRIYINCLIAMTFFKKLDKYREDQDISFLDFILPKEVTRFIVYRMNESSKYEKLIVDLGRRYNDMATYGKSEITYFLGRIRSPKEKMESIQILEELYAQTKNEINDRIVKQKFYRCPYSYQQQKQDLFLLRGIAVSLIYYGKTNILIEYIHSLINNDLCNLINRGFHLEYYGDKPYLPNQDTLDYEDNKLYGERTLKTLSASLEQSLYNHKLKNASVLELFTCVSLLQVRIHGEQKSTFDVTRYLKKIIYLIEEYQKQPYLDDKLIEVFFEMALEDFKAYLSNQNKTFLPEVSLCNEYLQAQTVKRTGWIMQTVPTPESIVEHMYSCWFIALVMLPKKINDRPDYNKDCILKMLLVHDLAETKLKDIPKYEKYKYPGYDEAEHKEMMKIFLKETYEGIDSLQDYLDAWQLWYDKENINAAIAKDIDNIQAVYQFCEYYLQYPEKFSDERCKNWLNELLYLNTEQGRLIAQKLVVQNEKFGDIIQKFGAQNDD